MRKCHYFWEFNEVGSTNTCSFAGWQVTWDFNMQHLDLCLSVLILLFNASHFWFSRSLSCMCHFSELPTYSIYLELWRREIHSLYSKIIANEKWVLHLISPIIKLVSHPNSSPFQPHFNGTLNKSIVKSQIATIWSSLTQACFCIIHTFYENALVLTRTWNFQLQYYFVGKCNYFVQKLYS